jgi:hypothetical protein
MFDGLYGMSENFSKKLSIKELCERKSIIYILGASMCDSNTSGPNA